MISERNYINGKNKILLAFISGMTKYLPSDVTSISAIPIKPSFKSSGSDNEPSSLTLEISIFQSFPFFQSEKYKLIPNWTVNF